ncbi:MAG: APC family permease [Candidatus Freyarchaeota archaeon]|nr:MAG: hypothetical protein DRO59_01425 [Candidatus Bathyarchaeota archaeon]
MAEEGVVFVRRASGLIREIGPISALSMALGHVIGGGINFHSTMDATVYPGASMPLAFLIAGIPSVLLGICFALMAIMMPRAGGDYIYITRTIDPLVGFLSSWAFWFTDAVSFGIIGAFDSIFWGMSLWIYGLMTGNSWAMDAGLWMQGFWGQIIIGTILVSIFCIIALLGTRTLAYVMNVIVFIPLVTGFVTIGYFIWGWMNAPTLALSNFDAIFGAEAADKVWTVAENAGFSLKKYAMGSNFASTMMAATPATWAYIGFTTPAFMGSEVKEPGRSFKIALIGSTVFILCYYVLLCGSCWGSYGDFITAYCYAAANAPNELAAALGVSRAPDGILPFFGAVLAYPNTLMMLLIAVTGAFWLMNDIPAFLMTTSRSIFAWSFDRFFPEFLADVNDRFHSPHWAITVTWIVGIIGVVANAYSWFIALVGTTVLYIFRVIFASLAATILPYKRPDIWEKGLRLTVAGIPLITIFGFISFTVWTYIFFYACLSCDPTTILTYMIWLGLGLLIFVVYWAYNRRKGIDPRTIYQEIPPL